MSLGTIFKQREQLGVSEPQKNALSEINTGEAVHLIEDSLTGEKIAKFHINLIDILDRALLNNNLDYLSIDQERLVSQYFKEGHEVDTLINEEHENPFKDMNPLTYQLDLFLGSYRLEK